MPVVAGEAEGRRGKADDGRARTREIKLGCLFTQTTLDEEGRPVRDPDSSTYLATFEPAEKFGQLLQAEARRRDAERIRQLAVLGDGAAWIWNQADQLFPAATQIVDLYHAREHLHELSDLANRLLVGHRDQWLAARLEELDVGDIDAVLAAGRALDFTGSLATERDKALAYFEHNAHRMRYRHFRELGMFVGSGVVEAGCKSLIGQRLKLSGMRWTIACATGIVTLRCHDAGGRWDEIWQRARSQTPRLTSPAWQADLATYRIGVHAVRQVVVLGDGAVSIWNIAEQILPAATQIVDLCHAREHVRLATLAIRRLRTGHQDWLAERHGELDAGDIQALFTAGRDLKFIGSLAPERDKPRLLPSHHSELARASGREQAAQPSHCPVSGRAKRPRSGYR